MPKPFLQKAWHASLLASPWSYSSSVFDTYIKSNQCMIVHVLRLGRINAIYSR